MKSAKLSFLVNGHPIGFFSCKGGGGGGVRQRDLLSPILFCILEDVLSRSISLLVEEGNLKPMAGPRETQTPSHVMFADDIMVFYRASKQNLNNLMDIFKTYGDISGQMLSLNKCKFYIGSMSARRIKSIKVLLGFSVGSLPFFYLGVPIFKGKPRRIYLQPITDRIKVKLSAWKGSLLSTMGKVQLVNQLFKEFLSIAFKSVHGQYLS